MLASLLVFENKVQTLPVSGGSGPDVVYGIETTQDDKNDSLRVFKLSIGPLEVCFSDVIFYI